jgi:dTDP-4-dehydrorhamnose 3,5-epimerase
LDPGVRILKGPLKGTFLIETTPYADDRGLFARLYGEAELQEVLKGRSIRQANYSLTLKKGAIRGMHYQVPPMAEAKFIRCLRGSVYDVVVDLRQNSPTFLKWRGVELSARTMNMLFVPEGFAHGFQTLEDMCELLYLHTEFYSLSNERRVRYDDPMIKIEWPLPVSEISERDRTCPLLAKDIKGIAL